MKEQKAVELGKQVKKHRSVIFKPAFWQYARTEDVPVISAAIEQAVNDSSIASANDGPISDYDMNILINKVKAFGMFTSVIFWQQLELSRGDAVHLVSVVNKTIDDKIDEAAHISVMTLAMWASPNAQKLRGVKGLDKTEPRMKMAL